MAPALIGFFLILTLLYVSFFFRTHPLDRERPLDTDDQLPFPAAGQASSIFSLSALFGAYLGMFVFLDPAVILGVVTGGVTSLVLVRWAIRKSEKETFEGFLTWVLFEKTDRGPTTIATLLFCVQLGFAVSELLILRDLLSSGFSLSPSHATAFATAVAVVAYFYCLMGGYGAVFRTDIVQFVFVVALCVSLSIHQMITGSETDTIAAACGSWSAFAGFPYLVRVPLFFTIGAAMGFSFLAASPDSWKRVFVVSRRKRHPRRAFVILVAAGLAPFVLILPLVTSLAPDANGPLDFFEALPNLSQSPLLLAIVLFGLVASFLSSFDSSLLSTVHIAYLVSQRPGLRAKVGIDAYYLAISGSFFAISFLFFALVGLGNAYFLANALLAPFALFGGCAVFLLARPQGCGFPRNVLWVSPVVLSLWVVYLLWQPALLESPSARQLDTVPIGMLFFFAAALAGLLFKRSVK
jgi:hypothetical protein